MEDVSDAIQVHWRRWGCRPGWTRWSRWWSWSGGHAKVRVLWLFCVCLDLWRREMVDATSVSMRWTRREMKPGAREAGLLIVTDTRNLHFLHRNLSMTHGLLCTTPLLSTELMKIWRRTVMAGKEQQWRGNLDGENSSAGTQTSRAFPMVKGQTFSLSTPVPSLHSTILMIRHFLFPFV